MPGAGVPVVASGELTHGSAAHQIAAVLQHVPTTPLVESETREVSSPVLSVSWPEVHAEGGVQGYFAAVGTAPGRTDVVPWTSLGPLRTYTSPALSMVPGQPLYVSVQARSVGGVSSRVGSSRSFLLDTTPPWHVDVATHKIGAAPHRARDRRRGQRERGDRPRPLTSAPPASRAAPRP